MSWGRSVWHVIAPDRRLRSERRSAHVLSQFATIEADSAWHFQQAIPHMAEPDQRLALFQAVLEETHHAWLFTRLSRLRGGSSRPARMDGRTSLIAAKEDIPAFLAYAQISEGEVSHDFDSIATLPLPADISDTLRTISADEEGHDDVMADLLEDVTASKKERVRLVRKARKKRRWQKFNNWSKRVNSLPWIVFLTPVYLLLGPLARLGLRSPSGPSDEAAVR